MVCLETTRFADFNGRWRDLAWLDLKGYVEEALRLRRLQARARLESTPIDKLSTINCSGFAGSVFFICPKT